jgi:small-conductance mechanosensitive channel
MNEILKTISLYYNQISVWDLWTYKIGRNNLFLMAFIIFLAYALLRLFLEQQETVIAKAKEFSLKTDSKIDDNLLQLLEKTHPLAVFSLLLAVGISILDFPESIESLVFKTIFSIMIVQFGFWVKNYFQAAVLSLLLPKGDYSSLASAVSFFNFFSHLFVWTVAVIAILDLWGVNVSTLVAGLGIGGIAVALAIQNILGDLLSSFSIILDKPFEVGDLITVGGESGTVEKVGIKTTRIRSVTGEQVVLSNSDVLSSRIHNFKRMYERRVVFKFGLRYDTPLPKLKVVQQIIKDLINGFDLARFERAHFISFGQFALDFEVVYFVLSKEYLTFMDLQQQINFGLLARLEQEGIHLAHGEPNPFSPIQSVLPK